MPRQPKKKNKSTIFQTAIILGLVLLAVAINVLGSFSTKKETLPEPNRQDAVYDTFTEKEQ